MSENRAVSFGWSIIGYRQSSSFGSSCHCPVFQTCAFCDAVVALVPQICYTVIMKTYWDRRKAAANLNKHGVSFEEASTVFADILSSLIADPSHSETEARFILLGMSISQRLLVVVHTELDDAIRIISARRATTHERIQYEQET